MTATFEMPHVTDCTATSCAYYHDGCHAYAVNIDSAASCGTFLSLNEKGGLDVVAQVGACQRQDCLHNENLECRATSITVGSTPANADCLPTRPPELSRINLLRHCSDAEVGVQGSGPGQHRAAAGREAGLPVFQHRLEGLDSASCADVLDQRGDLGQQTPTMRRHALAGLLYALPADRCLVDVRALAPLDPDQVAGLDGIVFVSDVPQGQPADLQC